MFGKQLTAGELVSDAEGLTPLQQFEHAGDLNNGPVRPFESDKLKIDGQNWEGVYSVVQPLHVGLKDLIVFRVLPLHSFCHFLAPFQ